MKHLKHHAIHLLMCAPMLLIASIAIASGASVAFLLPAIACMVMMGAMMGGMHGGHGEGEPKR
jgi:hypothetical protein